MIILAVHLMNKRTQALQQPLRISRSRAGGNTPQLQALFGSGPASGDIPVVFTYLCWNIPNARSARRRWSIVETINGFALAVCNGWPR